MCDYSQHEQCWSSLFLLQMPPVDAYERELFSNYTQFFNIRDMCIFETGTSSDRIGRISG